MLTQAEIDALLSGAIEMDQQEGSGKVNLAELMNQPAAGAPPAAAPKSPEDQEKRIQTYNFWSPDRFSKEQMRAVELIHEDLTERLTTSMPTFLRTNVRPRLVHTEQGRFHDFVEDFPSNSLFHLITLAPLPSQLIFTMSPNMSYMILEQRLGGKIEGKLEERTLTEIDQALLRELVEHMLGDIKASWGKVTTVEPTLEDSTTNMHWVQMMMGNERVLLLTFELVIANITGTMSMFIPFTTLKPIANILNPHIWITGRKEHTVDQAARQTAMENLNYVVLPIVVTLGEADIAFGDLMNLKIGDVIPLETLLSDNLIVQVAKKKQFTARVGKSGKYLAIQVQGVLRETEPIPAKS